MKKEALTKIIGTGIIAGVIGGVLTLGGQYGYNQMQANQSNQATVTSSKETKKISTSKNNATTAYNKIANAVVSVLNYQRSGTSSTGQLSTASEGSGVIYKQANGQAYIATNNHVIDGASKIQVLLHNGKKLDATLVGHDAMTDLAVLKIDAANISTVASFADSDKLNVGQTVLAIGSPLGSEYASSVTQGIVSATKRLVEEQSENGQSYGGSTVIQTDAAINPGNSGGPLINLAGQVVGINSMKLSSSSSGTNVEGMGFAIPSNQVVDIINKLVKDGSVIRPAIGIGLVNLSEVPADVQKNTLKIPDTVTGGVVIMSVTANGPAQKAGLQKYDVITGIDGQSISVQGELREELYKHKLGDTIKVTYYHGSDKKTVNVKLTQKLAS